MTSPIARRALLSSDEIWFAVPQPRTSLVGRADDVTRVADAVAHTEGRLVTLVGPGGVGKTRVAIEVARVLGRRFRSGAAFVALAGVTDASELAEAIAGSLHLAGASGVSILQALRSGLSGHEALIVLDNFEQLLDGIDVVTDLLDACGGVRMLITSRRPLRVDGEQAITLPQLDEVAAVELFAERATAVHYGFALSDDNRESVAIACRKLNGLPLAIELAAARMNMLSPQALVQRIDDNSLAVLARGGPDLPARQQSLRATIEWSHALLSEREQVLLRHVAVFENGFSFDACDAVTVLDPDEVLDALSALVDLHLVDPDHDVIDEPRFSLAVTIRDFAREKLAAAGEEDAIRERLVAHVVAFGNDAARGLESADEHAWLDRVERDLDQLRAVLAQLRAEDLGADVRLAAGLGPYWLHRGLLSEGRRHLEPAVSNPSASEVDRFVEANAAAWEARLAADQGVIGTHDDATAMIGRLDRGLAAAREIGDVDAELRCLDFLSHVLGLHDDGDRAVTVTDEGIAIARAHDRPWWLAQLAQRAAVYARLRGDIATASTLAAEAWALARQLGDDRVLLHAGQTVAQLPPITGIDDPPTIASLLDLATSVGDQRLIVGLVLTLAVDNMVEGAFDEAAVGYQRALTLASDTGYWHATGFALMGCAALAGLSGDHEACASLHGAAAAFIPVLRRGMPPAHYAIYAEVIADERVSVGPEEFDNRVADGGRLDWDDAIAAARTSLGRFMRPAAEVSPTPLRRVPKADAARISIPLTPRELAVVQLIAAGNTNKDIARQLDITPKTVMHHSVSIYRKLGVRGRAEATAVALQTGLIPD